MVLIGVPEAIVGIIIWLPGGYHSDMVTFQDDGHDGDVGKVLKDRDSKCMVMIGAWRDG